MKFIFKDYTEVDKPLFIVYTYDPKIDNISYRRTLDSMMQQTQVQQTTDDSNSKRRKRNIPPVCKVNPLTVPGSAIYDNMVGVDSDQFLVVNPVDYNAGICGGSCDHEHPDDTEVHNRFIFLLIGQDVHKNNFLDTHNYNGFKQCCSPIDYAPLQVLFTDGTSELNIHIVADMRVTRCECLYTVDYS